MKRRSFFATLVGLFIAPKFIEAKKPISLDFQSYPVLVNTSRQELNDNCADGHMEVDDDLIVIKTKSDIARIGHIIMTTKTDKLCVTTVYKTWELPTKFIGFAICCRPLESPKLICGRTVIKIDGKWRLFRAGGKSYDIKFTPISSSYKEY